MTLIAGFKCLDGFIIASDTEITFGAISFQDNKIMLYDRPDKQCAIRGGFAGDRAYGLMALQKIRDAVGGLAHPVFPAIKRAVESVVVEMCDLVLRLGYSVGDPDAPFTELVIGIEDEDSKFGILKVEKSAVFEAAYRVFAGSGSELAEHLTEKLILPGRSTALTEHFVQQLYRETKGKAPYVGGNTVIVSRRVSRPGAEHFFDLPELPSGFLWGMDEELLGAVRLAFDPMKPGQWQTRLGTICRTLRKIHENRLRKRDEELSTEKPPLSVDDATIERHTTEFGTVIGHPDRD